eukprot:4575074-Amphidinium_carterae.1
MVHTWVQQRRPQSVAARDYKSSHHLLRQARMYQGIYQSDQVKGTIDQAHEALHEQGCCFTDIASSVQALHRRERSKTEHQTSQPTLPTTCSDFCASTETC